MDLTTLFTVAALALGLIGVDTVWHAGSIVVEVTPAPAIPGDVVDQATLGAEFEDQLQAIASTPSVVEPPEIRTSADQGVGMELAKAIGAKELAYALQTAVGYTPDRVRLALYLENGQLRGHIDGRTHAVGTIDQVMAPYKGETEIAFVRRCALWTASEVAPYITALYLLQKHAGDRDFTDASALIEHAKNELPDTPISYDRSVFDNLRGIIFLFNNDGKHAQEAFDQAIEEYPANPVAEINAAFADLQIDKDQKAHDRMLKFTTETPPANKELLATAYMTWAAAEMALNHLNEADRLLAKSTAINPNSSSAYDLWAELKELQGDKAGADRYHLMARQNSATFENYGEVAALYFHLSWKANEPVTLSKFVNPGIVSFH
jgi:tetratricopeptide (TPR) repeat protein